MAMDFPFPATEGQIYTPINGPVYVRHNSAWDVVIGPLAAPGTVVSLYYVANPAQKDFDVTTPDHYGHTTSLSYKSTVHVSRSGGRVVPVDGFTVEANIVSLIWPAGQDEPIVIDIWEPV